MSRLISYQNVAILVFMSSALHFATPLFAGLNNDTIFMLVGAIAYLIFGWGLSKSLRWLAYIVFIVLLFGFVVALGFSYNGTTIPAWIYSAIAVVDLLAIIILLGCLWRTRQRLG